MNPFHGNPGQTRAASSEEAWSQDFVLADLIAQGYSDEPEGQDFLGKPTATPTHNAMKFMSQSFPADQSRLLQDMSTFFNSPSPQSMPRSCHFAASPLDPSRLSSKSAHSFSAHPLGRSAFGGGQGLETPQGFGPLPVSTSDGYLRLDTTGGAFGTYRDNIVSETSSVGTGYGKAQSAHGYFTGPATYSVASGEPEDTYVSNLTDPFESLQTTEEDSGITSTLTQLSEPHKANPHKTRAVGRLASDNAAELKCDYKNCGHLCRLPSQLKKHRLKHERPHRCDVTGCTWDRGFPTVNDLDRHKKSKHGSTSGRGPARFWQCVSAGCVENGKEWPRYDNFKKHVTTMHKNENAQDLIRRSQRQINDIATEASRAFTSPFANQDSAYFEGHDIDGRRSDLSTVEYSNSLACMGTWTGRDDFNSNSPEESFTSSKPTSDFSPFASNPTRSHQAEPIQRLHNSNTRAQYSQLTDSFGIQDAHSTSRSMKEPPQIMVQHPEDSPNELQRAQQRRGIAYLSQSLATRCDQRPEGERLQKAVLSFIGKDAVVPENFSQPLEEGSRLSAHTGCTGNEFIERRNNPLSGTVSKDVDFTTPPSPSMNAGERTTPAATTGRHSSIGFPFLCPYARCSKSYARKCDLKKHLRRHSRPFGCTFDCCINTSGSKNDWKRHETSQHPQSDSWRCELPRYVPTTTEQVVCAQLFDQIEDFISHLQQNHGITSMREVTDECSKRHIGYNGRKQFWCGFCCKIIPLEDPDHQTWDTRFNHIGTHFTVDEKHIHDWLPASGHRTKGEMLSATRGTDQSSKNEVTEAEHHGRVQNLVFGSQAQCGSNVTTMGASVPGSQDALRTGATSQETELSAGFTMPENNCVVYCCSCAYGPYNFGMYDCCTAVCGHQFCQNCFYDASDQRTG